MQTQFPFEDFPAFIEQTLSLWQVPGVAVAVVQDGEVILCEGFGARNVEQNLPVTAETIFPIASCTKAFTAMCIALLVDEGKLEWDKPVRRYLPTFKLSDPHATELMTPRDLLCHRSGLPRHDLVWYAGNFNRQEIFDRLQYVEPSRDFRSTWQYQNMMYMVAGHLINEISGLSWEDFLQERIFDQLEMGRSNTSTAFTQGDPNHSRPYLYRKGELGEIPFYEADENTATGPAGSINSCVQDLARWINVHLCAGMLGDQRFVSPQNLEEMHKPHVFIDDPLVRNRFGFDFYSYGLGWFLRSYKGHLMLSHGGNIDGFSSLVSLIPRLNLGIAVLSNGDGNHNAIPAVITNTIYDRLAVLGPTDWNTRYKEWNDELLAGVDRSKEQSAGHRRQASPTHPLVDYLGDYEHPGYGIYTLRQVDGRLELVTNSKIVMPVEHYHYDIFEARFDRFDISFKLAFTMDLKGNISGFHAQVEEMVKEVFFTRLPERRLSDPDFLAQFTGQYDFLDTLLSVELKSGKLVASLLGQEHELEPYHGTEFKLKDMAGHSINFQQDEQGSVHEAVLTSPNLVFTAARIR